MTIYLPEKDEPAAFGPPVAPPDAEPAPPRPEVAAALERMQAEDDALFVAASLADLAARHGAGLRKAEATAFQADGRNAGGFAAGLIDRFAADVDGMAQAAAGIAGARPSDAAVDLFRRQAEELGRSLLGRAAIGDQALRRHGQARATLAALDGLAGLVAADPDALDEAEARADAVIRAATPLFGAEAAGPLRARESRRLAEAALKGLIAEDPAEALTRLASGYFDARLDQDARRGLADRAERRKSALAADAGRASRAAAVAAGREAAVRSFAFEGDFRRRIAEGTASLADLADAEAERLLSQAQAARLRAALAEADRMRDETAARVARIAQVLADGGAPDPFSLEDREAVAAHWTATLAPALDGLDAAEAPIAIADYVGRAGIAPDDAVRRLVGACFGPAAEDRIAAAAALDGCLRVDPQAGSTLPQPLRDALRNAAGLAEAGLPPAHAIRPLEEIGGHMRDLLYRPDRDGPPEMGDLFYRPDQDWTDDMRPVALAGDGRTQSENVMEPWDAATQSAQAQGGSATTADNGGESLPMVTNRRPAPPRVLAPDLEKARQSDDLSDVWRDAIAREETGGQPHDGWGTARRGPDGREALGRFQFRKPALIDAGLMDTKGNWTGKYGINSKEDFLDNPEAQKAALNDYAKRAERYVEAFGLERHIDAGQKIIGVKGEFPVTRAGLVAAIHRQGAGYVKRYFEWLADHGWNSRDNQDKMSIQFKSIETRLRVFQAVPYRQR